VLLGQLAGCVETPRPERGVLADQLRYDRLAPGRALVVEVAPKEIGRLPGERIDKSMASASVPTVAVDDH
jgi:hypothetical protein